MPTIRISHKEFFFSLSLFMPSFIIIRSGSGDGWVGVSLVPWVVGEGEESLALHQLDIDELVLVVHLLELLDERLDTAQHFLVPARKYH